MPYVALPDHLLDPTAGAFERLLEERASKGIATEIAPKPLPLRSIVRDPIGSLSSGIPFRAGLPTAAPLANISKHKGLGGLAGLKQVSQYPCCSNQ